MKSRFRRETEIQNSNNLLPWEKAAPLLRVEAHESRSINGAANVKVLSTTLLPHKAQKHFQLADLGSDWFIDRLKPEHFEEIPAKDRHKLASLWFREALFERASALDLSRLSEQLIHFGAPSALVRGASRAILDELDHAKLSYSIVRALVGEQAQFKHKNSEFFASGASETCVGISDSESSWDDSDSRTGETSLGNAQNEELFQLAWQSMQQGVLVQELSARFAIQLSRSRDYQVAASELLKKSVDEHRISDLHWDVFAWAIKKLGKESVNRFWVLWVNQPKAKFCDGLLGDGKTRDLYREVREELSERLQRFFEAECGARVGENNQGERTLPVSRPAS